MKYLLQKILKILGPTKLIKMGWSVLREDLIKMAAKTETKIDDNLIAVIDEFIKEM